MLDRTFPHLLTTHAPLGGIVLLTYAICLPRAFALPNGKMRAWGGIQGATRTLYGVSIVLAALAYVWLMHALPDEPASARAFQLFLFGACLWAPLLLASMHCKGSRLFRAGVIAALAITSAGAMWLLQRALSEKARWGVLAASWLLFHVFVLDNLVWGYRFVTY